MIGMLMPHLNGGGPNSYMVTVGSYAGAQSTTYYGYGYNKAGSILPDRAWFPQPSFLMEYISADTRSAIIQFSGYARPSIPWDAIKIGNNTYPRAQWAEENSMLYVCTAAARAFGTTVGAQVPVLIL